MPLLLIVAAVGDGEYPCLSLELDVGCVLTAEIG